MFCNFHWSISRRFSSPIQWITAIRDRWVLWRSTLSRASIISEVIEGYSLPREVDRSVQNGWLSTTGLYYTSKPHQRYVSPLSVYRSKCSEFLGWCKEHSVAQYGTLRNTIQQLSERERELLTIFYLPSLCCNKSYCHWKLSPVQCSVTWCTALRLDEHLYVSKRELALCTIITVL